MNPEARIFILYTTGKTNFFLIGKNVLMVMVPILINKAVLEHSYNDLRASLATQTVKNPSAMQETWI